MPLKTQQIWLCDFCKPTDQREGVQTCPACDKVICTNHAVMIGGGGYNAVFMNAECAASQVPAFKAIKDAADAASQG